MANPAMMIKLQNINNLKITIETLHKDREVVITDRRNGEVIWTFSPESGFCQLAPVSSKLFWLLTTNSTTGELVQQELELVKASE